jgi:hypothetical protein
MMGFFEDMEWPAKRELYEKFVEEEEEKYKNRKEEELLREED